MRAAIAITTARTAVPVLMVSFDPKHDTPAKLKTLSGERNLDENTWTLANTDAPQVRTLAAVLGIQYRELTGGDFNHTSVIILLDGEGRIVGKTFTLGEVDVEFVKLVSAANAARHTH